jgi:DNA-binding transcriptional LysR family regulator
MKPANVTIRQLEYFVAAVDLGTFSAAARHFHVSQTAVSLALTDLERLLGVQLLVRRRPHGPALTAAGRSLAVKARRILADTSELEAEALSAGGAVDGSLVVGSFPTITPYVMGKILAGLPERHPGLTVDLIEDSVDGLQRRLKEGTCDVAIMYDIGIREGVSVTPLYRCRPHAVLPARHRLAGERAVDIAALIAEPMILIDLPPSAEFFLGLLARAGYTPTVSYRPGAIETVRTLVGRGLGWSLLLHQPATAVSYDGGQVVHLPVRDIDEGVDVLLVRVAGVRPTARVQAFTRYCKEVLPSVMQGA